MTNHSLPTRWTTLLLVLPLLAACGGAGRTTSPPSYATHAPQATSTEAPVRFRTGDGNVDCNVEPRHVVCNIGVHTWAPPNKPAECRSTWGATVQFTLLGHSSFVCGRRASYLTASRVLAADELLRVGSITCRAVDDGVRCFGEVHGFLLTKARHELF